MNLCGANPLRAFYCGGNECNVRVGRWPAFSGPGRSLFWPRDITWLVLTESFKGRRHSGERWHCLFRFCF